LRSDRQSNFGSVGRVGDSRCCAVGRLVMAAVHWLPFLNTRNDRVTADNESVHL
jgi:hypothetical protein